MINSGNMQNPPAPSKKGLPLADTPASGITRTLPMTPTDFAVEGSPEHTNREGSADSGGDDAANKALGEFRGVGHTERISGCRGGKADYDVSDKAYRDPANLSVEGKK